MKVLYFQNENGDTIRVEVSLGTECTISNQITYFKYNLYLRKCKIPIISLIC